jgi:hypothetical protein
MPLERTDVTRALSRKKVDDHCFIVLSADPGLG